MYPGLWPILCAPNAIETSGERVWANPRAIMAMMRQCNTVDVTRRSPSYEVRLTKYAKRGFEVYIHNLRRQDIDPTVHGFDFSFRAKLKPNIAIRSMNAQSSRSKALHASSLLKSFTVQMLDTVSSTHVVSFEAVPSRFVSPGTGSNNAGIGVT